MRQYIILFCCLQAFSLSAQKVKTKGLIDTLVQVNCCGQYIYDYKVKTKVIRSAIDWNVPRCLYDTCKPAYPEINFERNDVLYTSIDDNGFCSVSFLLDLKKDSNKYTLTLKMSGPFGCKIKSRRYNFWAVVPKLPANSVVEFKEERIITNH